jgi:predicted Rossmann fold nucleotide-binding protein DprA/Smf involved in DNA uptake
MKQVTIQMKSIAKDLSALSKKVDKLAKMVDKAPKAAPAKAAPAKKAAPKKKTAAKAKTAAAKAKPPAKAAGGTTVLDSVYDTIKRSRKGITIAKLKEKTNLNARQLSNALYKLSKKNKIQAISRGLYAKK